MSTFRSAGPTLRPKTLTEEKDLKPRLLIASALLAALLLPSAQAKDIPNGGFTVADVVQWLQEEGFQAKTVQADNGDVHVNSKFEGISFSVFLLDCEKGRCGSIQFAVGWKTEGKQDAAKIAEWNRDKRWGRAYLDADHDPWLEMDVDISPGGTYELLNDEFLTYRGVVQEFVKGFLPKPGAK